MWDQSPYKNDFLQPEAETYLDTGAEGLLLKHAHDGLLAYAHCKAHGSSGRPDLYEAASQCKQTLARFLGVDDTNIALVSSASEAINSFVHSMQLNPGDEVIITDLEFPSNVLPWLQLQRTGVVLRIVKERNRQIYAEDVLQAITSRTKVIAISLVSYKTGVILPTTEIFQQIDHTNITTLLDATQAMGRIPVPLDGVDFCMCSSYKWLLGVHGLAVVYCSNRYLQHVTQKGVGWYSVRDIFTADRFERFEFKQTAGRLELGMPNFPAIFCLQEGVQYLHERWQGFTEPLKLLTDYAYQQLQILNADLMTPDNSQIRAGIIAIRTPQWKQVAEELYKKHIVIWGGDDRIRISIHLYNGKRDIDRIISELCSISDTQNLSI